MLNGLRKAGKSPVGKVIATMLFCILIASFAVWGIGDIFLTARQTSVAQVGDTQISTEQFRAAYNRELQRLGRQYRTTLTSEQARALGIDQNVLSRLVTEAVLDERARALGLSVSDQLVVRSVVEDPTFVGSGGQFDRTRFEQLLRDNGLTEGMYVQEQRAAMARIELVESMTGALPVPAAAREALHRYGNERRTASYAILPAAAAGVVPAATDEQLQAYFNERKAAFKAPEYRAVSLVTLSAEALANPESVSDADARQRYEQQKARFGTPERRTIQQISFPTQEEADAAVTRIKEGAAFEAIAAERKVSPQDLELGTFVKAEMVDPAVADAAFSLQEGAASGPVQGRFGIVLVRVSKVEPEAVRPFEDVAGEIKRTIAQEQARSRLEAAHDEIEDMRAGAKPLAEIAAEKKLQLVQIPAVTRDGRDKAGNPIESLPERQPAIAAAFASDIGVDNEALRDRNGGYTWFDVTGIEPARDRTFDEVRAEVERQWRADQIAQRLSDKARELVERVNKGETIEAIAGEAGAQAKTATDIGRGAAKDDLTAEVVNRVFATPVGRADSAAGGPESRVIFKVAAATVPPLLTTTQEAQQTEERLRESMLDDLIAQYVAHVRKDMDVEIHPEAVRQVVGGEV